MSGNTLPVLTHPAFPQVFEAAISQEVNRHAPQLSLCCYEAPESHWGACDGIACSSQATVHDVATELDYCFAHWKVVGRG